MPIKGCKTLLLGSHVYYCLGNKFNFGVKTWVGLWTRVDELELWRLGLAG